MMRSSCAVLVFCRKCDNIETEVVCATVGTVGRMQKKTDTEDLKMEQQKRSFSDIAHMSTLKPGEADDDELEVTEDTEAMDESTEAEEAEETVEEEAAVEMRVEHTEPKYSIQPTPSEKEMVEFLVRHTYCNAAGVAAILLALGAIALVIFNVVRGSNSILAIVLGVIVLFLICNGAFTVVKKAKTYARDLAENPAHRITYTFSDAGFDLERGSEYAGHEWSDTGNILESSTCYYFYIGKTQAFAIPKAQLGDDEQSFRRMVIAHVDPAKIKLKNTDNQ